MISLETILNYDVKTVSYGQIDVNSRIIPLNGEYDNTIRFKSDRLSELILECENIKFSLCFYGKILLNKYDNSNDRYFDILYQTPSKHKVKDYLFQMCNLMIDKKYKPHDTNPSHIACDRTLKSFFLLDDNFPIKNLKDNFQNNKYLEISNHIELVNKNTPFSFEYENQIYFLDILKK